MDVNGTLREDQMIILSAVYLVSLTPSLIGSASVLLVSIVKWQRLQEQVLPLVQLALADFLASLILMFTSAMNLTGYFRHSVSFCQRALPLSLTFYLISFLMVVVYSWKSKNIFRGWRVTQGHSEGQQNLCQRTTIALSLYTILWSVPVAIYLLYVIATYLCTSTLSTDIPYVTNDIIPADNTYCTSCILFLHAWGDPCPASQVLHDAFIKVLLFLALIPALVSSSVMYYKVGYWYNNYDHQGLLPGEADGRTRHRLRRIYSTARNMVLIILFCWTPALLLTIMSTLSPWTKVSQNSIFSLYIIQAVSMSLQGFLNSMVYAWRRPNFIDAVLGESTPLLLHERQAFFEDSLRTTTRPHTI
ncbi:transmembrane protein 116 isoform X1 [Gadus macrocephalus]|uniref:transmembrane protein 116 isoform X1 n=1 Tax=Gadus macrocephalus TaxID=80720 RepID=UPI0028CB1A17|nr:transmembrane protein 116 isoform X1 [Gadus macrocephalus]